MNRYTEQIHVLQGEPLGEKIWGPMQPLTATELEEIEQGIGARLPEDYREFIVDFGMYTLPPDVYCPVPANEFNEYKAPIEVFYGLDRTGGQRETFDLLNAYRHAISCCIDEPETWPPLAVDEGSILLPVVWNSSGSSICIHIKGDELGKIDYFPPFDRGVHRLADSFDEFMHLLVLETDDSG